MKYKMKATKKLANYEIRLPGDPPDYMHFKNIEDVSEMFEDKPFMLIAYIKDGLRNDFSVMSVHLVQLAKKAGMILLSDDLAYHDLQVGFVKPSDFSNIGDIIAEAKIVARFPNSKLVH